MDEKVLIWYENVLPPKFEGKILLWNIYQKNQKNSNLYSIPYVLENESDKYRKKYLDLIDTLSQIKFKNITISKFFEIEDGFSLWWMNLSLEKNYGKSPNLCDSVKIIALEDCLELNKNYQIFYSSNTPNNLIQYLKKISKSSNSFLTDQFNTRAKFYNIAIKDFLPNLLLGFISFLRFIKFCGGLKFRKNKIVNDAKLYFFDYFLHIDKNKDKKFDSGYWGELFEKLEDWKKSALITHLYVPSQAYPNIKKAKDEIKELNNITDSYLKHNSIEYITFPLALKVFYNLIKNAITYLFFISFKYNKKISCKELRPVFFLWKEVTNSIYGSIAVQNLFYFYFILDFVHTVKNNSKLIYLMENQGWEKALLYLWKKNKLGKAFGVAHATIRYWDLRYAYSKEQSGFESDECYPDFVAANGELASKQLIKFGHNPVKLVQVEALRFSNLPKIDFFDNSPQHVLLVFTDYLETVSKFQMRILEQSATFLQNFRIIVKPHPAYPILIEEYPKLNFEISNKRADYLLSQASIVFSSNITSAAIEAYYLGLPIVSSRDPKDLNLSPLFGIEGIKFVSSSEELKNSIDEFNLKQTGGKRNDVFNFHDELSIWKTLIEN